jgi:hypothetical protein
MVSIDISQQKIFKWSKYIHTHMCVYIYTYINFQHENQQKFSNEN